MEDEAEAVGFLAVEDLLHLCDILRVYSLGHSI